MADFFSPYQINYEVKNTSKTFGFSKKKIIFKFGIANPPAIANGDSGSNCRGSEHEIIFIWSLNSGKRQIMSDGKDIHFSETGSNGWTADQVFQHHFEIRVAGLSGPIRAHLITQPANKDVPHIKPFDLRLNGVSYFAMPHIFQLGTPQMVVRPVKGKGKMSRGEQQHNGGRQNRRHEDDSQLSPNERQAIAAAKLASMQGINGPGGGYRSHAQPPPSHAPAPVVVDDLISFDAPPVAPQQYGQQPPPPQAQAQYSNYSVGAPPQQQQQAHMNSFASQPSQSQQQYQQPGMQASQPIQNQQLQQGSFYGQPPPPQQQQQLMQQPQQGAFYGQQPPPALAPAQYDSQQHIMVSPNAKSVASYQSYGSAPAFAQPPQQQQQQHMQQQPQQGAYYGQPPAPQGY